MSNPSRSPQAHSTPKATSSRPNTRQQGKLKSPQHWVQPTDLYRHLLAQQRRRRAASAAPLEHLVNPDLSLFTPETAEPYIENVLDTNQVKSTIDWILKCYPDLEEDIKTDERFTQAARLAFIERKDRESRGIKSETYDPYTTRIIELKLKHIKDRHDYRRRYRFSVGTALDTKRVTDLLPDKFPLPARTSYNSSIPDSGIYSNLSGYEELLASVTRDTNLSEQEAEGFEDTFSTARGNTTIYTTFDSTVGERSRATVGDFTREFGNRTTVVDETSTSTSETSADAASTSKTTASTTTSPLITPVNTPPTSTTPIPITTPTSATSPITTPTSATSPITTPTSATSPTTTPIPTTPTTPTTTSVTTTTTPTTTTTTPISATSTTTSPSTTPTTSTATSPTTSAAATTTAATTTATTSSTTTTSTSSAGASPPPSQPQPPPPPPRPKTPEPFKPPPPPKGRRPPKPPSRPPTPPSPTTMADPKAVHEALAKAIDDMLDDYTLKVTNHKAKTPELNPVQVGLYLEDLKAIGNNIYSHHTTCYKLYKDDPHASPATTEQTDQLTINKGLTTKFDTVRTEMTTISRQLTPVITATRLKVPKIQVPEFSGSHAEWMSFKDQFSTLVGNVATFSRAEKIQLLKDALKNGEARRMIKDLKMEDGSWDIGWTRLTERYDSPRESAHAALRPLMEFRPLCQTTEKGLHKLIATVRTTQAQLKNISLAGTTIEDVLYTHFIMSKIDTNTINEFNRTLTTNDIPKLDIVIAFLEKHAKNLSLTNEIRVNSASASASTSSKGRRSRSEKKVLIATQSDTDKRSGSEGSQSSRDSSWASGRNRSTSQSGQSSASENSRSGSKSGQYDTKKRKKRPSRKTKGEHEPRKSPRKPKDSKERYRKRSNSQSSQERGKSSGCEMCGSEEHRIHFCKQFKNLSTDERQKWVRDKQRCYNCLRDHFLSDCQSSRTCSKCGAKHNSLLHKDGQSTNPLVSHAAKNQRQKIGILPTAIVDIVHRGKATTARCLLDTGSQSSFITEKLARRLKLNIKPTKEEFIAAGGSNVFCEGECKFLIQSQLNPEKTYKVQAYVLHEITTNIPQNAIEVSSWKHIEKLPLADPSFNEPGPVEILLGSSVFDQLLESKKIRGRQGLPSAYNTHLGYVVMGETDSDSLKVINNVVNTHERKPQMIQELPTPNEVENFDMERFWKIEELPTTRILSDSERFCEEHYQQNTVRLPNGQYQIRWPFKQKHVELGQSSYLAISRFHSVERKLLKNPELLKDYNDQLQEYLDLDQMEEIPNPTFDRPHFYLPHHAVFKESSTSTKVRVVFDASAKTSNGVSLNDILEPGPTIQPELFDHLLKFRLKTIAIVADISKMYRNILIHPDEQDFSRIVWRKNPKDPIKHYRIKVVPFGTSPAPFLACRTLLQISKDEGPKYPLAKAAIEQNFYVDDYMDSLASVIKALEVQEQLIKALETAHFELRKFSSNSTAVLEKLAPELRETQIPLTLDETTTIKTLGLKWNPASDDFTFELNFDPYRKHTKRSILSDISRIFDPLGFLSPVTIRAKIIMQLIWQRKVEWDQQLPDDIQKLWQDYAEGLPELLKFAIPRYLGHDEKYKWELHGFSDASEKAYSAVVFLRGQYKEKVRINMVVSKTRVAPLKTVTIPRLEMQGAVLAAQLVNHVRNIFNIKLSDVYLWTDSTIVLSWIHSSPIKWKIYIANRVTQIQELSEPRQWRHIRSEENPADCASRGISPAEILTHQLWKFGPKFLSQPSYPAPQFIATPIEECGEEKKVVTTMKKNKPKPTSLIQQLQNISSWKRTIKVMAILMKIQSTRSFKISIAFTPSELETAERKIALHIQKDAYAKEFLALEKQDQTLIDRHLRSFGIFLDPDGLIRGRGRLHNSSLPYSTRHPILLPGHSPIVKNMIRYYHEILGHAPKNTVLNHIQHYYWIPNGAKFVKGVINKCLTCFRFRAKPSQQLMGDLPAYRVNEARPFLHTGVDLAGPYQLRNFSGRKNNLFKVWICLFNCMTTRAVHLELVSSLSQDAFLLALRRFMSRRGRPSDVYSDNGTNFVGAENILTKTAEDLANSKLNQDILPDPMLEKIRWHFNPPRAPHAGGAWEICVKLVKKYLTKMMKEDSYTWEGMSTVLAFIESLVNSRPLTPLSNDPADLEALTPALLLYGYSLTLPPEHDLGHLKINLLSLYQLIQRRSQDMWKRFPLEYLTTLQKRNKWQNIQDNIKPGDMVLVLEDNVPALAWRLGRVKEVHPGKDGLTRVSTIESEGTYKNEKGKLVKSIKEFVRPITKLAKLPINDDEDQKDNPQLNPPKVNTAVRKIIGPLEWLTTMLLIWNAAPTVSSICDNNSNKSCLTDETPDFGTDPRQHRKEVIRNNWIILISIISTIVLIVTARVGWKSKWNPWLPSKHRQTTTRGTRSTQSLEAPLAARRLCIVCGLATHSLYTCETFQALTPKERRAWTRTNKRCLNCLGRHPRKRCYSTRKCVKCDGKHHNLLHNLSNKQKNPTATTDSYRRKTSQRNQSLSLALLSLLTISTSASSCMNYAVTSTTMECQENSTNHPVCNNQLSATLSLSPIGQTSCLRIENSDNQLLGHIIIETKEVKSRCVEDTLYYLPEAFMRCQYVSQCASQKHYNDCSQKKCEEFQINDTIREFKDSTNVLGWSLCQSRNFTQCSNQDQADCLFFRLFLENPSRKVYKVFNCSKWIHEITINSTLYQGDKIIQNVTVLQPGLHETIGDIDINLLSSKTPNPIQDRCIIANKTTQALTSCELQEVPPDKMPGIQCNSSSEAAELSPTCLTKLDFFGAVMQTHNPKCLGNPDHPDKLMQHQQLPLNLQIGVLRAEEQSIIFEPAIIDMKIQLTSNDFHAENSQSHCAAKFIQLTGCFSCSTGATLSINAKTSEKSNEITFECPEVNITNKLQLTNEFQPYEIPIMLDTPEVRLQCQLVCLNTTVPIFVTGELQAISNYNDQSRPTGNQVPDINFGLNPFSLGTMNWHSWIFKGLLLLALGFAACLIPCVIGKTIIKKSIHAAFSHCTTRNHD